MVNSQALDRQQCDKGSICFNQLQSKLQPITTVLPLVLDGDAVPADSNKEPALDLAPSCAGGTELCAGGTAIPGSSSSLSVLLILPFASPLPLSCKVPSSNKIY